MKHNPFLNVIPSNAVATIDKILGHEAVSRSSANAQRKPSSRQIA
jgi:hypothetical protein